LVPVSPHVLRLRLPWVMRDLGFGFLALPSFISSCGLGGIVNIRRAIRSVASSRSGFFAMPPRKPKPQKNSTPPIRKAWDIRPKSAKGSATADDIYRAVGMALTSWEYVENALADAFTLFVGAPEESPPRVPALRAYGAIVGFQSRAAMLDAAGEAFFHKHRDQTPDPKLDPQKEKLRGEFVSLLRETKGHSDRRNDIGHGIVSSSRLGSFLYPPDYNARKYPLLKDNLTLHHRAAYAYTADDIHHYRKGFEELYDKLSVLCTELRHIAAYERRRDRERTP
jgi:hypothetical protein